MLCSPLNELLNALQHPVGGQHGIDGNLLTVLRMTVAFLDANFQWGAWVNETNTWNGVVGNVGYPKFSEYHSEFIWVWTIEILF